MYKKRTKHLEKRIRQLEKKKADADCIDIDRVAIALTKRIAEKSSGRL